MISILWFLPILGALLLLFCRQLQLGNPRTIAMAVTGVGWAYLLWLTLSWSGEAFPEETWQWIPQAGLALDFWLDGPALFYCWIVYGIGFLVIQYAGHYMDPSDAPWRFYTNILFFLAAMLGLVMSRNFLLMFVFWEVTSLTSFLLIGHWHRQAEARKGARRALLITAMGGLSLLVGVAILAVIQHQLSGAMDLRMDYFWANREAVVAHPLAMAAMVFMLGGALTKSAQFPFHFWLPGAMNAPTPVSALLHAATMVKAGIYLMGRMYPIFGNEVLWAAIVGTSGVLSMLIGGYLAIVSVDIKKLLAYSTVSQLGLLTSYYGFGFGSLGSEHLLKLDLLLVASHALFKAGLFMLCGVIDHGTHTRNWDRLGGLVKKMPMTAALTIMGCISMAGLPFSLGFVAKKIYLHQSMELEGLPFMLGEFLMVSAIVASIFTVGYCYIVAIKPFFGKPRDQKLYDHAHEGGFGILFAPTVLIGLCLIGGIYVPFLENPIAAMTNLEFYGIDSHFTIAWFPKMDTLFWISMAMYVIFAPLILIYQGAFSALYNKLGKPSMVVGFSDRFFDEWVPSFATFIGGLVKPKSHKITISIIFTTFLVLVGIPLWKAGFTFQNDFSMHPSVFALGGLTIVSILAVVLLFTLRNVYTRILSLSLIGLAISGVFLVYKAPDLALTQILVELVVMLMFLGLVARLKKTDILQQYVPGSKVGLFLGIASGLVAGLVTYHAAVTDPVVEWPDRPSVSDFYLENALYPVEAGAHSGGGNNVVNVTLVDFRALDTMGEIIVLIIAALGVLTILSLRRRKNPIEEHSIAPPVGDQKLFLIKTLAKTIVTVYGIYAVVLFLAGHQMPGGGFIAGLLAAVVYIPFSLTHAKTKEPPLLPIMGLGILASLGIGVMPMLFGDALLKSSFGTIYLPVLGGLKLSTAMVFDIGVFLIVLAVTYTLVRFFSTRTYKSKEEVAP